MQEVSRQSVSEEHMDVMRTAASVMDLEAGGLPGTPISLSPPPTRSGMQTSANTTPHGGGGSGGGGGSTSTVAPLPAVPSIRVGV